MNDIEFNQDLIDDSSIYSFNEVDQSIILDELDCDEEDKLTIKSIIDTIESQIAIHIKKGFIVNIPYIGNIQRSVLKDKLNTHNKELQLARSTMTKEDFKEYYKELRRQLKNEVKQEEHERKTIAKFRNKYKDFYITMAINRGRAYIELYIKSILWLSPIEYNQEIQDQYDRINGIYEE